MLELKNLVQLFNIKSIFRQNKFEIYTDGSVKQGRGSWAFVVLQNGKILFEQSGRARRTTCNRMEFQAAIEAIKFLPPQSTVQLFTDSRILIDTMTKWIPEWKNFGWVKKNRSPIPSVDLIQVLDQLNLQHNISWNWIKAHSGNVYNERCDQLCILARKL